LPSQQFCEAFTAPWPPQMFPGGLQAVPPAQRLSFFELSSHSVGPGFFPEPSGAVPGPSQKIPYALSTAPGCAGSEPPQHEAVPSQ
jgi:hypothetical protein